MSKPLPPEIAQQIADHVFAGNKLAAIKLHREYSGEGLKESKDFVASLETELRTREPYRFANDSEDASRVKSTVVSVCAVLAVLLAMFLWHDGNIAAIKQWWGLSTSSVPGSRTTHGRDTLSSATTNALPQPQVQQPLPVVEHKSVATNAPAETSRSMPGSRTKDGSGALASTTTYALPQPQEQQPATVVEHTSVTTPTPAETKAQPENPVDLSGVWRIMRPPSLNRTATLTRVDGQHYKLTPANLAFQGVYAWDGKTLSMESGNRGYRDLTWELTTSGQFTMVKGAYRGATMKREQ